MANLIADYILDNGLNEIKNNCTKVFICNNDPTTYTEANTGGSVNLGVKTWTAGSAFGTPSLVSGYEQTTSTSIPDGAVSVSGSATKWAVADGVAPRLHANGSLSAPTSVVSGTTFQLAPFIIKFPQQ